MAVADDDAQPVPRFNLSVPELTDDDFIFEPNGWDFAVDSGICVDPAADAVALDELADFMLVSLEDRPELERATDTAIDRIWSENFEGLIRERVAALGKREEWAAFAAGAEADLDRDPRRADVAREVVRHLAMQLAQHRTPVFFCLHCLEEQIAFLPAPGASRELALQAALATCRTVEVSENELRAAVRNPAAVQQLGTPERRVGVRRHVARLAAAAADTLPHLALALQAIAAEPLPAASRSDDVWQVVVSHLVAEAAAAKLN
jgi:hypothetical protein